MRDSWTAPQRAAVLAAFLGWMLDAFDFFLVVFVFAPIAREFHTDVSHVTYSVLFTLALRPVGAFLFGRAADRFGRRPALVASVVAYSGLEFASALAPSLGAFLLLRALFGVAMGGEWGVGAALALENVPVRSRGAVSGLLQVGYPTGYLLAAVVYGVLFDSIGWRGMLMVGAVPALLALFILKKVPEPLPRTVIATERSAAPRRGLSGHWGLALYAVALMTAMNVFSHGTQDLYPTLLGSQRGFATATISHIAIVYNAGAILGGLFFGRLSSRIGRRRTIALAVLLALPALPFWAYSTPIAAVALGAFAMQLTVQGAWSVVPAHLNELSPAGMRATFPGVVYQLGNLLASYVATFEAQIAALHGAARHPDYAFALSLVCGIVIPVLIVLVWFGPERRDVSFAPAQGGS